MTTDAPTFAPVPIRMVAADGGTALTLTRAHLEEIRQDYPDRDFKADRPFVWGRSYDQPVVRAVFVLLPDEHGHVAHLRRPDGPDDPIYRALFRRYQP